MANKGKDIKFACLHCGTTVQSNFYVSKDKFNNAGKIPYCKDCIKNVIYPYYLSICANENIALHHLLRSLNVPYIHSVYISSLDGLKNPKSTIKDSDEEDKTAIVSAYFKNYNSFHDRNGYGDIYNESDGLENIDGLMSFDEIVKVKHNRDITESKNGDYEIIEYDTAYLIHKYGNLPVEDLTFLEEEYLQWQDKLGDFIKDQSIKMNVIMLCNEYLKIRKKNERGENAKEEITTIQNIMRTSGLAEKINQNEAKETPIGMDIKEIERHRPLKPARTELDDVDGYRDVILGFAGATSRALGKENQFTKEFDRIMKDYNLDIFGKISNSQKDESEG